MDSSANVKELAGNYFKSGYNCSEAVLRAFNDALQLGLSVDALKMAAGFGGGLGHAGCICGALNASVMVLGLLKGRTDHTQSRSPVYGAAEEFHNRFQNAFGATCCRVLNPHPFDTKDHLKNCLKITGKTADLLMQYIQEKAPGK